jgi:hypothetical protein
VLQEKVNQADQEVDQDLPEEDQEEVESKYLIQ